MQTQMKPEDKKTFDYLNTTSYLLRLNLNRLDFDIQPITLMNDVIWHVFYKKTVIGTVTFRTADNGVTYCNVRLYKYLHDTIKNIDDFIMSEYFEYTTVIGIEKPVRFNFDKFDEYFNKIKAVVAEPTVATESTEKIITVNDSIARLKEYCEQFDLKFTKNTFVHDVKNLLKENDRLHAELKSVYATVLNIMCKLPGGKK